MNTPIKIFIIFLIANTFGYAANAPTAVKKPNTHSMDRTLSPINNTELTGCGKLVVDATAYCCAYSVFSVVYCTCPCSLPDAEKTKKNT